MLENTQCITDQNYMIRGNITPACVISREDLARHKISIMWWEPLLVNHGIVQCRNMELRINSQRTQIERRVPYIIKEYRAVSKERYLVSNRAHHRHGMKFYIKTKLGTGRREHDVIIIEFIKACITTMVPRCSKSFGWRQRRFQVKFPSILLLIW